MTNKIDLHLAYVLHARAFRETSLLVEMLSQDHGRITVVARGAKRGKSKTSSIMQPFMPLNVSWYGSGDLVTLTNVEAHANSHMLHGRNAICGLYLNELLVKLMPKWDPCPVLFAGYEQALLRLMGNAVAEQITLRKFEVLLLKSLGYGLQLTKEVNTGVQVRPQDYYLFDPILGPKLVYYPSASSIKGASLLALEHGDIADPLILADLKRLMRVVLGYHLGARRLVTRELLYT